MIKKKTNGVYLCLSENRIHGAVTSTPIPPFTVEKTFHARWDKEEEINQIVADLEPYKTGNYVSSRIAVSPESRFVRRFDIDPAKLAKNDSYLIEIVKDEFRIEAEKYSISVVDEANGKEFDPTDSKETKVIFCGMDSEELRAQQNSLVEKGLYPESLELASVASLGAIVDYTREMQLQGAVLILDVTSENSQVFVVRDGGIDVTRPIPYGVNSMIPVVKQELGLKDDESARKLFFSNTFDFTEVGPKLLKRLIRELQASTGFYEVQTGQTIAHIYLPMIPTNLRWIIPVLADSLGVGVLSPRVEEWMSSHDVAFDSNIDVPLMNEEWFGLFALICPHTPAKESEQDGDEEKKEEPS